ncbi:MAG: cobalamin-dependent protein [Eubacteriales bacterium]|nr:cobalamin-dependent protein [Eubacteriales bacterium]MDD4541960.1 cobalamin-dependent protein [Eubacteriales bacterium]
MADDLMKRIAELVAEGDDVESVKLVKQAIADGYKPMDVLTEGAAKGMDIIGEAYDQGEAYLPELVLSGDAMTAVVEVIFEELNEEEKAANKQGTVVIGQAKGDVHDIGKNIVSALLAVNGFTVVDLGIDVEVKTFYEKAKEHKADIVGMSTLLTTSLPYMEDAKRYFADTGVDKNFFFIVGGGPVTTEFATELGVDGWSRNAFDCVELCKELMANRKPGSGETLIVDSEAK